MKLAAIALGGNALIRDNRCCSPKDQKNNLLRPAKKILKFVGRNNKAIVTHGNGPQVGKIWDDERKKESPMPLHECVEQTQKDIGKYIEYAFRAHDPDVKITTIITHVRVEKNDPAFASPTKGIGEFFQPPVDMDLLAKLEESGSAISYYDEKGYREVVASPMPKSVIEIDGIRRELLANDVVVACGGGGIPLFKDSTPARAVVDKDLASGRLASRIGADFFVILTNTGGVALDFNRGREEQDYLAYLNCEDAKGLLEKNYFESGTIMPKVMAAARFVDETGNGAHIGNIDGDIDAILMGKEGTTVGKGKTRLRSGKPVKL